MDEALDNMKFLRGIKKHVEILHTANDFKLLKSTLRKVMKSLRYAWMLSKHYNTDEKIVGLIGKVNVILRVRVCSFVQLKELGSPDKVHEKAQQSLLLLQEWEMAFQQTRLEIERSEREKRWEFSVRAIFEPINHAKEICADVINISSTIGKLSVCFSPLFVDCTLNTKILKEANQKIEELAQSFSSLRFRCSPLRLSTIGRTN